MGNPVKESWDKWMRTIPTRGFVLDTADFFNQFDGTRIVKDGGISAGDALKYWSNEKPEPWHELRQQIRDAYADCPPELADDLPAIFEAAWPEIERRVAVMNRKIVGKPCEKCGCATYLSSKPFGAFHNSQWLCDQCAAPFFKA